MSNLLDRLIYIETVNRFPISVCELLLPSNYGPCDTWCVIEMYPRVWTSGLKALPKKAVPLSSPFSSWPLLHCLHLCTFLEPSLVKSNGKFKRDGKTPRIFSETHIHENMSLIGCCPQKHFSISKVGFFFSWSMHDAEKWALKLNTRIRREDMLETSFREPSCSHQPEFKVQGSF